MARGIQRLEAGEDLFRRALSAGLGARALATDEDDTEASRSAATWRSLRLTRLEGLDPEAQVPPPLLALSADAAFDVAEPEPEETPPTPRELEEALSEAVELPDDWAMVAALAGGTNTAHCLKELLEALDWNGAPRQVAEALPDLHAPLNGNGAARTMEKLGYQVRSLKARINELGPQDFPALFVTTSGDALVLRKFGQHAIPGFDGASRTRRPIARDRRQGTAYVLRQADVSPSGGPLPAAGASGMIWSALRPRLPAVAVATAGRALFALAAPLMLLVALDYAVPSGSLPMILFYAGAAVFAVMLEFTFHAWSSRLAEPVRTQTGSLSLSALARTLLLPPSALVHSSAGARRSRYRDFHAGGDATAMRVAVAMLGLPTAAAALGGVWVLGGPLVAAPLIGGVVIFALWAAMQAAVRRAKVKAVRTAGGFAQHLADTLQVRDTVVAMGAEELISERLMQSADDAYQAAGQDAANLRWMRVLTDWTAIATVAATAVAAGRLGISGDMTLGGVAASVLLSWWAMTALTRLAATAGDAARLGCGLDQAQRLHALRPERPAAQPSPAPRSLAGHVDVSGVSTAAGGGVEMPLDGVSLYADPGDVVAVVGDYQSGKSALLRVLAGLQETRAGHARLDGVETSLFDPVQLRQSVAYVPETPAFLPLTIEDNLRLMNPVASDSDLQTACELAGVMEEIRVLETGVGNARRFGMAVNMAQFTRDPHPGFFKRLALARGYLRHSGLLLLDGPERQLDPEGEQALSRAIEQLRGAATVIIATDRPQLIRLADRVLWLDGGRMRAEGPSSTVLQQLYEEGRVGQTLAEQ